MQCAIPKKEKVVPYTSIHRGVPVRDSRVASGYSRYSLNTLNFSEKIKICNVNGQ